MSLLEHIPWDLAAAQLLGDRERQEDAVEIRFSVDPLCCLLAVADGLGGHGGGQEAAISAIGALTSVWDQDPGADETTLSFCMEQAGKEVARTSFKSGRKGRTTLVAVAFDMKSASWTHLGDSRLYRFRLGDRIHRTKDHSVARLMVEMGEITEEEAVNGPDQGRLYKSLGPEPIQEFKIQTASLIPEDAFLLCSDGFWTEVAESEMAAALQEDSLTEALAQLAETAVQRSKGKSDNVTVCAARPKNFRSLRQSR